MSKIRSRLDFIQLIPEITGGLRLIGTHVNEASQIPLLKAILFIDFEMGQDVSTVQVANAFPHELYIKVDVNVISTVAIKRKKNTVLYQQEGTGHNKQTHQAWRSSHH